MRFEADDNIPDFLRGKTAKEAVDITKQLYDMAMNAQPQQQRASPQPSQESPPMQQNGQQTQNAPAPPNPDLMYSDPAEWQRQYDAYQNARMQDTLQRTSQPFLQSQAQMARSASRNDPDRSDIWERYSLEIDREMQSVPLQQRVNVEAWNMAADLIAGRHRKELMQDYAERNAAQPQATGLEGASSGDVNRSASPVYRDELSEMFANDHPAALDMKERGMTEAKVRENLHKMGHTPESYAALLKKHGPSISYSERKDGRTVQHT